eukprot:2738387-Pyramimonas_sp.AAC.1
MVRDQKRTVDGIFNRIQRGARTLTVTSTGGSVRHNQVILRYVVSRCSGAFGVRLLLSLLKQVQRVALARTIFRNCPVLILDEPTSAQEANAVRGILTTLGTQ